MSRPKIGTHLKTPRKGITHHGIYCGRGKVIHYSGPAEGVKKDTLKDFEAGCGYIVVEHPGAKYSGKEAVKRACSRLGEDKYTASGNNCEHFVEWCIEGRYESTQVKTAIGIGSPLMMLLAGLLTKRAVSVNGMVTGVSGSGVMSGLASTGAVVGGGAAVGMGVLSGAGGLSTACLLNNTILADNEALENNERDARAKGRVGSYVGAATGTAGGLLAIRAMGKPGLSAVGITSGLSAVGRLFGGGMIRGVCATAAVPVLTAVILGLGVHQLFRLLDGDECEEVQ